MEATTTRIDRLPCVVLASFALILAGCGTAEPVPDAQAGDASNSAATHPISGLEIIPVTIVTEQGPIPFKAELAATQDAQTRGLMFRTELADDEGMLFPADPPEVRSFWMRNTPISLDIIFVGTDGRILNIAENTEPYSLESLKSEGLSAATFEIRGGLSKERGIAPGDAVEYDLP